MHRKAPARRAGRVGSRVSHSAQGIPSRRLRIVEEVRVCDGAAVVSPLEQAGELRDGRCRAHRLDSDGHLRGLGRAPHAVDSAGHPAVDGRDVQTGVSEQKGAGPQRRRLHGLRLRLLLGQLGAHPAVDDARTGRCADSRLRSQSAIRRTDNRPCALRSNPSPPISGMTSEPSTS